MDSITQAALGAVVAGAAAGKRCNAKVLLAGAALGTLPDLDVLIDYGDPISDMVKHRGFSHSLFVLLPFSALLAGVWQQLFARDWPYRTLFQVIALALVTHPLLDWFTSYGTQLLWPIPGAYSLSSIFIIDPLFTLPLLIAVAAAVRSSERKALYCTLGVAVSALYLTWTLVAQYQIRAQVEDELAQRNMAAEQIYVTPTPFNSVLWRVVVLQEETYAEGLVSFFDDSTEIAFIERPLGAWPFAHKPPLLQDLITFSDGYISYTEKDDQLVVADLRMGMADFLAFQFVFAKRNEFDHWRLSPIEQLPMQVGALQRVHALFARLAGDQSIEADLCRDCDRTVNVETTVASDDQSLMPVQAELP
uniref:metal-dependent hydrolase n=1 Tax=Thaumasiovibrio occultus TaxID=1891184 RepID=UPI000B34ADB0|nr:metal-dependent hydrolase [Thaumasiovibrio occultus]